MKKTIIKTAVVLLVLATAITSCKKYPEGPGLSLRSKAARIANKWKIEKIIVNGTDVTSQNSTFIANYTETYTKDGVYSYTLSSLSGEGKWEFNDDKTIIKVNGVSGASSKDETVLKLKEKEFWYTTKVNGDETEYHLVPAE